jgi:hypothetical protein
MYLKLTTSNTFLSLLISNATVTTESEFKSGEVDVEIVGSYVRALMRIVLMPALAASVSVLTHAKARSV